MPAEIVYKKITRKANKGLKGTVFAKLEEILLCMIGWNEVTR